MDKIIIYLELEKKLGRELTKEEKKFIECSLKAEEEQEDINVQDNENNFFDFDVLKLAKKLRRELTKEEKKFIECYFKAQEEDRNPQNNETVFVDSNIDQQIENQSQIKK